MGISVVQDYSRFYKVRAYPPSSTDSHVQYNPIQLAEKTAAARDASAKPATEYDATEPSGEAAHNADKPSRASIKHAGRDARASEIANRAAQPAQPPSPYKRKMDIDELEEGEAGPKTADDVEEGEMVEGSAGYALEGEEWEEVITDGKVLKMRKVDRT